MRWVDVPFSVDGDQMYTQQIVWPQCCACCGGSDTSDSHQLNGYLKRESHVVGSRQYVSGFSRRFHIPYCAECKRHAGLLANTYGWSGIAGFLLWVLVGYLMFINGHGESALDIIVFILTGAVIGYGAYVVSKRLVASRSKPDCVGNDYAVSVSLRTVTAEPPVGSWRLRFENDAYAADFAGLNGLQLLQPADESQ